MDKADPFMDQQVKSYQVHISAEGLCLPSEGVTSLSFSFPNALVIQDCSSLKKVEV